MTLAILPAARRQLPLRVHIATLFIALILLLGGVVIWNNLCGNHPADAANRRRAF